jgi:hypothetical protein
VSGEPRSGGLDRSDLIRLGGLLAVLGIITAAVLLLGGSGGGSASGPSTGRVQGVITQVDETKIVLAPDGGGTRTFVIRPQDLRRLDLFHLREHSQQQLESVVWFERAGSEEFATRVDDAPVP